GSIEVVDRKIADKIHVSNFSLFHYFFISLFHYLFFLSLKILLTEIFYSAGTSSSVVSAAS
ncbi:hypothetical protein, partial [Lactococcus sp.]|uniref:hypothetical protein n=1 Tax=Lactococcus sp. TaxID=44273 RepID=UPI002FCA685E